MAADLTALAAFDEALALDPSRCTLTVSLASSAKDAILPGFQRLQLAEHLLGEFRQVVAYLLSELKRERDSRHLLLRDYRLQSKPDPHEVEWLSLVEHESVACQLLPLGSPVSIDLFREDPSFIAGLRFYVISVWPKAGEPVHFYRAYSQKKVLGRSPLFAIWLQDGTYDRVSIPVFLFDQAVDCVSAGNWMFVLKKEHFHEMFRTAQALRQSAGQMLEDLRARVPIANFEAFAHDCEGHLVKLAKLRSILSKGYLESINMERIKQVITTYGLALEVVEVGGTEMLRYDPRQKWVILKLLDDDYLWSPMTGHGYETSGKREVYQERPL
jgi:Kiwa KwaB-like protein